MPSNSKPVTTLPSKSSTTTSWTGAMGVRPASTRKVAVADKSATPTAQAPTSRDTNGTGVMPAESSAATWSTIAMSKGPKPAPGVKADPNPEVMLLYNNVAQ